MMNFEILENIDLTVEELAYQLTAYEKWGFIDYVDGLINIVVNVYLDMADDWEKIEKYNEYLAANSYEVYESFYDPEEFFNSFSNPYEAVRAAMFGKVSFNDDYIKFNGAANLESYSKSQVIATLNEDMAFKAWMIREESAFDELMDEENKQAIIREALKLVAQGY